MKRMILTLILLLSCVEFANARQCVAVQVVSATPSVVTTNGLFTPVTLQPSINTFSFQPVAVHSFSQPVILSNAVFVPQVHQQVIVQRVVNRRIVVQRVVVQKIRRGIFRNRTIIRTRTVCR